MINRLLVAIALIFAFGVIGAAITPRKQQCLTYTINGGALWCITPTYQAIEVVKARP